MMVTFSESSLDWRYSKQTSIWSGGYSKNSMLLNIYCRVFRNLSTVLTTSLSLTSCYLKHFQYLRLSSTHFKIIFGSLHDLFRMLTMSISIWVRKEIDFWFSEPRKLWQFIFNLDIWPSVHLVAHNLFVKQKLILNEYYVSIKVS